MISRVLRPTTITLVMGLALTQQTSAAEPTDFPAAARKRYDEGRELQKQGQLKGAIQAFNEAIKLGMEMFPRVYLQRAKSSLDLKEYDEAIAEYTKVIDGFGVEESCRS